MSHAIFDIFLYSKKSLRIWSLNLLGVLCFILRLCISDFQSHAEFNVKSLKQPCGIWCLYLSDLITHHSLAASLPRPLAFCAPWTHQVPASGPLHLFPLSGTLFPNVMFSVRPLWRFYLNCYPLHAVIPCLSFLHHYYLFFLENLSFSDRLFLYLFICSLSVLLLTPDWDVSSIRAGAWSVFSAIISRPRLGLPD